jgi:hypothetical protein
MNIPASTLKVRGGWRCLYLWVCRFLIEMAEAVFLIFVADPRTVRLYKTLLKCVADAFS